LRSDLAVKRVNVYLYEMVCFMLDININPN
jgi:hypothetical protein